MNLKEITDLISIRQYVSNATGNMSLDRSTINELNGILILLDKKIVGILKDYEFKDYIGYQGVKQAIEDVARITNIKFGLKK